MILPGETEAGSAGMQPCRGIAWWAHRDDAWERGSQLSRSSANRIGSKDPNALKIPARRAEFTLTENASAPFQAEPEHGNINGATYSDLDLNIIDDSAPLDMLSSTALPASSLFITRANFIQFEASNGNANSAAHILKQFGPTEFTFTADATPEPGTAASFLLGAIGLIVLRRRQRM